LIDLVCRKEKIVLKRRGERRFEKTNESWGHLQAWAFLIRKAGDKMSDIL